MLAISSEPFADTTPADLSHSLIRRELPAIATMQIGPIEMRVLGASHQIIAGRWIETVACDDRKPGRLPARTQEPGYSFTSSISRRNRGDLEAHVTALKEATHAHPGGLAVAFAGDPLAITAIQATVSGNIARWKTWHVYPNTSEIVTTRSTFLLPKSQGTPNDR